MMFQITVRTAEIRDFPKIACLKRDAYSVRGYCSQGRAKEQYLIQKGEFALVATRTDEEILGTMTVSYDDGGLPCDEWFPNETARVRDMSRKVAYYGTFAVKPGMWRSSIGLALIRKAIARAGTDGIDAGICIVNPRHVAFYGTLGFKEVGRRGSMPGLDKAPAVMLAITGEAAQNLLLRSASGTRIFRLADCEAA
ncbi:MAG: GNAT family N-acetyltransferase [Patescibacteria group bacterium]